MQNKHLAQLRNDFASFLEANKRSVLSVAEECGLEQSSLSRFKDGKQGLSAGAVFALGELIYGHAPFQPTTTPE